MQRAQQQRMAVQPRETRGAAHSPLMPFPSSDRLGGQGLKSSESRESGWVDFGLASLSVNHVSGEEVEASLEGHTRRGKVVSKIHGVGLRAAATWNETM